MQTKETITLSGVPETMLQTVYARAKESSGRGAIRDRKAEETIGGLQYDFSLADRDKAMHSGVIARTIVLDRLTGAWLQEHPGGTVVNVACGLDTRCYRMEGYGRWYNLDLPETIAVRQRLLPENGAISQIAMSAMDDWGGCIAEQDTPALVIIEGLTMYLTETDVQRIFSVIAGRFRSATVLAETMNPMVVKRFREKSIEGSHAKFTWGVKNGAALAALLRIGGDSFTLTAINDNLKGCGLNAVASETETPGVVEVRFPDVPGIPDGFESMRAILEDILPCHLDIRYVYWYITWALMEERFATWGDIEKLGPTWEELEKMVRD